MIFFGYLALLLLSLITCLAFYGLTSFNGASFDFNLLQDTYIQSILLFTLKQAALSSILSVALALPMARALYYLPNLWGKRAFLALCLLCFVMPTFILITGLVALLGRSGYITPYLGESWNLYGLQGILIAHVYLNMPFDIRSLYLRLQSIPQPSWRLARQLKLTRWQSWCYLEWPTLRSSLFAISGLIFVLCFNSFAVVLALGGGPQSTTLELAIYQALKYDFNLNEALTLAWLQFSIAGAIFLVLIRFGSVPWLSIATTSEEFTPRFTKAASFLYRILYSIYWLVLLMPFLAIVVSTLDVNIRNFNFLLIGKSSAATIMLGLVCSGLALSWSYLLHLPIRLAHNHRKEQTQWFLEFISNQMLIAPTMVVSVGLYILLLDLTDIDSWSLLILVLLNTAIVLPFSNQYIKPRLLQYDDQYYKISQQLKMNQMRKIKIEWIWIKSTALITFILAFLLVMGDVAIFSLFGYQEWQTLPWLVYSYANSYRMPDASFASAILLLICIFLIVALERVTKKKIG